MAKVFFNFNKNQLLSALSLALDLAENKTMEHARRTAYIALGIARDLGLPETEVKNIYSAAFLHDIGVTEAKKDYHQDLEYLKKHPVIGYRIVRKLPFPEEVARCVLLHHANWDGSGVFPLAGDRIPLGAQIIYLADQLDIRYNRQLPYYQQKDDLLQWARDNRNTLFHPEVVDSFLRIAGKDKFWLDYTFHNIGQILVAVEPPQEEPLDLAGLQNIAQAFALIIDNKSQFTLNHSKGVTQLVARVASALGYPGEEIAKLEIAAELHDLGKLAVPNAILDKAGPLTSQEFQIIKGHSYYTKAILSMVTGFEEIKEWAANHHETLDGAGYPEGKKGDSLALPERILTVCDIYQALTEARPYRQPLTRKEAYQILGKLEKEGKICSQALAALQEVD